MYFSSFFTSNAFFIRFVADGKFHVVPSGGDLHIIRADFADAVEPYSCRVRNTLSGKEETSAPYTLVINGTCQTEKQ